MYNRHPSVLWTFIQNELQNEENNFTCSKLLGPNMRSLLLEKISIAGNNLFFKRSVDRLIGGFFTPCRQQRPYSQREVFVFIQPAP